MTNSGLDAIDKTHQRLELLSETASQLLASDKPQQIVNALCRKVLAHLDCHAFFNYLVDEPTQRLHLNACGGIPDDVARRIEWLDYGVAVCGCAARDGCRIVAQDIPNTPDPRTELVKSFGIRAYACHPLLSQGRVIGTLSFGTRSRSHFSDDDLALMKTVTDQVAVAMERIRAQEALQQANAELERRVEQRTGELQAVNRSLQDEIAERTRMEDQLRAASRYSRGLLEASLDPLVTISPQGKITDVNQATELVTGVGRDRLIGSDFCDYFTRPDQARAGYQAVISQGLVRDYPLTIRHVSGMTTDVLYNATVYRNASGEVQGVFAAARDVTEQKASQRRQEVVNALLDLFARKSARKEYLDAVVEVLRGWIGCQCLGIRVADADGNIPYESCAGFEDDFLQVEKNLCIHRDACVCIRAVTGLALSSDAPLRSPGGSFHTQDSLAFVGSLPPEALPFYRANCMRFGFQSLAVVPIRYRGQVLGVIHLADRRTHAIPAATVEFIESMSMLIGEALQRFQAEAALREQAALLHLAHDAILVRDPDSRIAFWSRGAEETYGYSAAEAIGQVSHELLQTRFPVPIEEILASLARQGQWQGELEHVRRDGRHIVVASRWAVQETDPSHHGGILEIGRDITDRKRAEEELARYHEHLEELVAQRTEQLRRTAEDLGRSNQDLEQFAYVASHDLQEPLRAVAGFVGLLQSRCRDLLDEENLGFIEAAVDGARRMQALINDLLSYSRVSSRGKTPQPTEAQVAVERALTNLHAAIHDSQAVIAVEPLPTVRADALQLVLLFQNLLGNAIKFRGERPPEIHVRADRRNGDWVFSVRDNGIGIEPQYAERIFLIFQRLHTRTKYPGTGIGLAICKKIVERHGGRIWVESPPQQGSTFLFTIPDPGDPT